MNYWHNYDIKHNENFLCDCNQLTHKYRNTFSSYIVYYLCMNSSVSSGFTHFAYIFYL